MTSELKDYVTGRFATRVYGWPKLAWASRTVHVGDGATLGNPRISRSVEVAVGRLGFVWLSRKQGEV